MQRMVRNRGSPTISCGSWCKCVAWPSIMGTYELELAQQKTCWSHRQRRRGVQGACAQLNILVNTNILSNITIIRHVDGGNAAESHAIKKLSSTNRLEES